MGRVVPALLIEYMVLKVDPPSKLYLRLIIIMVPVSVFTGTDDFTYKVRLDQGALEGDAAANAKVA